MKTCWRQLIEKALGKNGETFTDLVSNTLSKEELAQTFEAGYGGVEGKPFTAWSENFVYFPLCYDGAEWVGSVARNPNGKPTKHQGGG